LIYPGWLVARMLRWIEPLRHQHGGSADVLDVVNQRSAGSPERLLYVSRQFGDNDPVRFLDRTIWRHRCHRHINRPLAAPHEKRNPRAIGRKAWPGDEVLRAREQGLRATGRDLDPFNGAWPTDA